MGFSADIDIAGGGAGSSLSVNGGKTTLIGGAITTTEAARDAGRNRYTSADGITMQDIENTISYNGDAIQVGVSIGNTNNKPQASMNGLGYGSDSDSYSSVTRAGITGIAGNKDITTDNRADYAGILENSFDAGQVNEELGAQTQITQEFGKEAPKAVGDVSSYMQFAMIDSGNVDAADKWAEGGADRVALHTLVGAIATGSVEGALASGTTAVSVPAVDKYLEKQGVDETTKSVLLLGLSAGVGSIVGGDTASTASSVNQTQNNYLNHIQLQQWINDLKKAKGNGRRIDEINTYYKNLDKKQQAAFTNDCETNYNYQRCGQHIKNYYAGSERYNGDTLFDPKLYSQIENLGGLGTGSLRSGVTFNNDQFANQSLRWQSDAAYREDSSLVLARSKLNAPNGHSNLANGRPVIAAGEAKFVNGELLKIDNKSGHYKPSGESAKQNALKAFKGYNLTPKNGYVEVKFE